MGSTEWFGDTAVLVIGAPTLGGCGTIAATLSPWVRVGEVDVRPRGAIATSDTVTARPVQGSVMAGPARTRQASPESRRKATLDAVSSLHCGRSTYSGAPLGLRLKVYVIRRRLDRQIAVGHSCEGTPELMLRAHQLTDPRTQQKVARNLRGILHYVERPVSRRSISSVIIEPAAVWQGRRAILDLAEQLERGAPVNPRGVLLAQALLTDALNPISNPHSELTVTEAVREVHAALEAPPTIGSPS